MIVGGKDQLARIGGEKNLRLAGWVAVIGVLVCYSIHIAKVGLDWRQDFWVFWAPEHAQGDIDNAMKNGDMVLRHADDIAQADLKNSREPLEVNAATIEHPGPGLFDSPFTVGNFLRAGIGCGRFTGRSFGDGWRRMRIFITAIRTRITIWIIRPCGC